MGKKAVLFDIDGTLLDAWDYIFEAVKYTAVKHNQVYPSDELLKKTQGKPLLEFYLTAYPSVDPNLLAQTHHDFQAKNFQLLKLYPKVKATLQKLKKEGFLLAAVSNRSRNSLVPSLEKVRILNFFDVVVAPEDVENPKPHPQHLQVALKHLQVKSADSLMVGDTDKDILAGKAAKVKTIGVTYGFLGKDIAKHKPDYLIDEISQLLKILKQS